MVFACIFATNGLIGMESKKPEAQSMIEFFIGIKKQNYDFLPGDLKKEFIENPLTHLLLPSKRPWHYIEHSSNDGSLSFQYPLFVLMVPVNR